MKKQLLSLLLLLAWLPATWAQEVVTNNTNSEDNTSDPCDTKVEKVEGPFYWSTYRMPKLMIGLRGGMNLADMRFSYDAVDRYTHYWRAGFLGGIFAHIPINNTPISLRPEISYITRGDSLNWLDVEYGMKVNYLDFRVPITWNFRYGYNDISPYVMLVPQVNVATKGYISYDAEDYYKDQHTIPVTKASLKSADFALMIGAGVDFTINTKVTPLYWSIEAGYNFGLINNFAKREIIDRSEDPSIIYNEFFGAELWHKRRFNRGVEVAMRIAVPLDNDFLAQHRNKFKFKPDTVTLVEIKTDTVTVIQKDTVIKEVPKIIKTIVRDTVTYQTKECFTISEINNLLEQGIDIAGKRICMFNINFDFNKATIREESFKPLNEMARLMYEYPEMRIEVYGHTDSIGTAEYNQKLSERRAQAVVEYLGKQSISPNRIKAFGYGLKYPIDTNATEEGRFRNRRVEFEILTIGEKRKYDQQ